MRFRKLMGPHVNEHGTYFKHGQVITTDVDLVRKFGSGTFVRVGGGMSEEPTPQPYAAPGGQASEGFQVNRAGVSGAEATLPKVDGDEYDNMSDEQLRAEMSERELDTEYVETRDEMLLALRGR